MKFIGIDAVLGRARRFVSGASNVQEEEVKDPSKLAEILRGLMRRMSDAECLLPPEATEFEVELFSLGGLITLNSQLQWTVPVLCSVLVCRQNRCRTNNGPDSGRRQLIG
jgi:hypothetical protein